MTGTSAARPRTVRATGPAADQRADRVRAGLAELEVWLGDQARAGLAGLARDGGASLPGVAARMVDAQAPGVAARLRALPARLADADWPSRVLEELALLRLLAAAHRRLDRLPEDLAATVRSRVGAPTPKRSVLEGPAVHDEWAALGAVDVVEDRLASRRVWLHGARTGRWALLLSFGVGGDGLDDSVLPGTVLDAGLHPYRGAGQLRALVGARHGPAVPLSPGDAAAAAAGGGPEEPRDGRPWTGAVGVARAAALFGELLAADPWAQRMPVLLVGAPLLPGEGPDRGDRWWFRGEDGAAVPLVAGAEAWEVLARSVGDPVEVMGEWTRDGFLPLGLLPHPLDPVFRPLARSPGVAAPRASAGAGAEPGSGRRDPAPDPVWETLVTTALLGTDRRPLVGLPAPLAALAAAEPDSGLAVLAAAAGACTARRAAYRPPGCPPPAVAPRQRLDFAPDPAQATLARLLGAGASAAVDRWLRSCAERRLGARPRLWCPLADAATRPRGVDRSLAAAVLGERGLAVAARHPRWRALVGVPPAPTDRPAPSHPSTPERP